MTGSPFAPLARLVRQGRAFGIHVLLGSQTLAGAYSLAANARQREAAVAARFASAGNGSDPGTVAARPYLRSTRAGNGTDLTVVRVGPFGDLRQAQRAARRLGDAFVGRETAPDCPAGNARRPDPRVTPVGRPGG